jgi:folate-binding protein YgfZ
MLLRLGADACAALLAKLDALVFSEDVQLGDVTGAFQGVTVVGPEASAILCAVLGGEPLETLPEHGCRRTKYEGGAAVIVRADDLGVPGFELLVEATYASSLEAALRAGGAAPLDVGTAEVLRVEQGVPKFHQDMDEETIPLEAGIEQRAISLTKGCYVGQEVIIRVLHRGHGRVARRLVGLLCAGAAAPPPGAIVVEDGQQVGRVTSSARSPALGQPIVLAYVRRESAEEGRRVAIEPADREGDREGAGSVAGHGAVERIEATVAPLPFIHATP